MYVLRTTTKSVLDRKRRTMIPSAASASLSQFFGDDNIRSDSDNTTRRYYGSNAKNSCDATTVRRSMSTALKPADHIRRSFEETASTAVDYGYVAPAPSEAAFSNQQVFPSLVIGGNGRIEPQGTFAEAQAEYLNPDPDEVSSLTELLSNANMGVVAHYYMDVELQGVLDAVKLRRPEFVAVADSLIMGDHAVKMAKAGATSIACLGVDFMAESVAAIMAKNGFSHVPVYRAQAGHIGCSLAESAERDDYRAWLTRAAESGSNALHVVYINTSLRTKAVSASIVPTITCTSSNVLKTILQASAQVEDVKVHYGPDTYMGENLRTMLNSILDGGWTDERIKKDLHPEHDRDSLRQLADGIEVYPNGNCVVHHMFGGDVTQLVKDKYADAYVTAHLEVPGEMFEIAMAKSMDDHGVVGSTSDILKFITRKVKEARDDVSINNSNNGGTTRLKFVLGTEAGMVTSIVREVEEILSADNNKYSKKIEAEIIFPVASEAVATVEDDDLALVPGVRGGEGCSTAGGCATCPFMKMNDLDALANVAEIAAQNGGPEKLIRYLPPRGLERSTIGGRSAIELGVEPIMYMREFMGSGRLSDELVGKIYSGVSTE